MGSDFVSFGEQRDKDDWWFNKVVICHDVVDTETVALALDTSLNGKAPLPQQLQDAVSLAVERVACSQKLKSWSNGAEASCSRSRFVPEHILCVHANDIKKSNLYRFWRHTDDGDGSISVLVFLQDKFSSDDIDSNDLTTHCSGTEFWAVEHFENPFRGPACEILPRPGTILLWDGLTAVHRAKVPHESCPRTVATGTIQCGASAPQLFRLNKCDTFMKFIFDTTVNTRSSTCWSFALLAVIIVAAGACRKQI